VQEGAHFRVRNEGSRSDALFLGIRGVAIRPDEIFLNQGKYTVEILQRFGMMDCNSMATPMVMNLKLLRDSSS
jgi:hypothetical protein